MFRFRLCPPALFIHFDISASDIVSLLSVIQKGLYCIARQIQALSQGGNCASEIMTSKSDPCGICDCPDGLLELLQDGMH